MAKTTKNFEDVIREKKAKLEIIEALMKLLNDKEEYYLKEYVETGKEHQRKDWSSGKLLWLDENGERTTEETGKPYMEKEYDYVFKTELDEEDKAYQKVIDELRDTLASLV